MILKHLFPVVTVATLLLLDGCQSRLFLQAQHVVVTAVPAKVAHCHAIGNVEVSDPADDFDDRMTSLKEDAVLHGANSVLVMSPATSVNGIGYQCNPPLKSDEATAGRLHLGATSAASA